jgi:hypothetical protein
MLLASSVTIAAILASAPAEPYTGPTGRGRLVVVPPPDPLDPLGDPAWHRRDRRLRIATGILGATAGLSLLTFTISRIDGSDAAPAPEPPVASWIALGVGVGALVTTAVVAGLLDRHHRSALRYIPTTPDLRADRRWIFRDRALRGGLYASATLGSAGILAIPFAVASDVLVVTTSVAASLGVAGLIATAVLATKLRRHRKQLTRWPRLGATGLTMRF